MPNYRRAFVPGGTFFFTLVTFERKPFLTDDAARPILHAAIDACRARWPFTLDAIVLLPDHLHAIWTLPDGDADFSKRWAFIKRTFTAEFRRARSCVPSSDAESPEEQRHAIACPTTPSSDAEPPQGNRHAIACPTTPSSVLEAPEEERHAIACPTTPSSDAESPEEQRHAIACPTDAIRWQRRRAVWQPRFIEHTIRDERDYENHLHYLHFNPVKHGYVNCPHAWPWSSFARHVREKIYESNWCCSCDGHSVNPPTFEPPLALE